MKTKQNNFYTCEAKDVINRIKRQFKEWSKYYLPSAYRRLVSRVNRNLKTKYQKQATWLKSGQLYLNWLCSKDKQIPDKPNTLTTTDHQEKANQSHWEVGNITQGYSTCLAHTEIQGQVPESQRTKETDDPMTALVAADLKTLTAGFTELLFMAPLFVTAE